MKYPAAHGGNYVPAVACMGAADVNENSAAIMLARLATVLGVSETVFLDASPSIGEAAETTAAMEVADLLQNFMAIEDPKVRKACLDFIRVRSG